MHTTVSVRVPAAHDLVPERVLPVLHVGVHDAPCASVEVQSFRAPLATAVDASQELPLHTDVSVRVPALQDLVPEMVYPLLQVGVHDDPCASVEVQPDPAAPFDIAPDASHGSGLHTTVSVRAPAVHDLVPERV